MKEKVKGIFKNLELIKKTDKDNEKTILVDPSKEFLDKVLEGFSSRRSIRRFSSKKVDYKLVFDSFEAARHAPCAGGIENWRIVLIEKPDMIAKIAETESEQYWINDAPLVIAIVRDDTNIKRLFDYDSDKLSIQTSAAFITSFLTLLHFSGLGACWVESCDREAIGSIIGTSGDLVVDAIIPIGYPIENPKSNKEPIEERIYFENYGTGRF